MKQKNMRLAGILACLLALSCAGCGVQGGLPDGSAAGEPQQSAGETSAAGAAQEAGKNGAVPQASNGYLVSQEMGRQVDIDLDGDGTADTLQVSVRQVERGEGENTWTESVLDSIVIHGKEQAATGAENPLEAYRVYLESPDRDHYFITDLDTGDKALEIALLDYGPSDDPMTWYFQYRNGALKLIGSLPGFPDDEGSHRDGSGNVMAVGRLSLLQTWNATFPYTLKDGTLAEVAQSQYVPLPVPDAAVALKQKLTIYAKPDQAADTVTVEPSEEPVTVPVTDNRHWVQMRTAEGTEGWVYLKDFSTIVSDGEELSATDVFDNLVIAD